MITTARSCNPQRTTAIHEAGHALAHIRLGICQGSATIVASGVQLGLVSAEDSNWNKEAAAEQVIALCAGYGALRVCGHDDQAARLGADCDFDKAKHLIEFWGLGDLEEWLQKTVEFLGTTENLKALEALSSALLEHQTLGASYMSLLVDYSDGEISEAEWRRYVDVTLPSTGRTPSTDN